jgi:mitochondrial fission protein ELM1
MTGSDAPTGLRRTGCVLATGPERAEEAVRLGWRLGVPVIGLGQPGTAAGSMDLVLATPQFVVTGRNVVRLPYAISPYGDCSQAARTSDAEALERLPRPLGLLLVGGPAGPWSLDGDLISKAAAELLGRCRALLVMTSARTPSGLRAGLRACGRGNIMVDAVEGIAVRMASALRACDEVAVTGDSVSMVSEAAAAGRPVSLILPTASREAVEAYLRAAEDDPVRLAMPGDLRRFWASLDGDPSTPRTRPEAKGVLDAAVAAATALIAASTLPLVA